MEEGAEGEVELVLGIGVVGDVVGREGAGGVVEGGQAVSGALEDAEAGEGAEAARGTWGRELRLGRDG